MGKDLNRPFSKDDYSQDQRAHAKLLNTTSRQKNANQNSKRPSNAVRTAAIQNRQTDGVMTSVGEDVENLEPLCIMAGT